jgi:general secretion pathway protein G
VEIMIVVAIIALLAAIAIPNVLRGRATANETAAIGNLRALMSSLEMYRAANTVYPATANWLANMYTTPEPDYGPPAFAVASPMSVQGYTYTYVSGGAGTYTFTTVPATPGSTGTRGFFTNEAGQVRHCTCVGSGACGTPALTDPTVDGAPIDC